MLTLNDDIDVLLLVWSTIGKDGDINALSGGRNLDGKFNGDALGLVTQFLDQTSLDILSNVFLGSVIPNRAIDEVTNLTVGQRRDEGGVLFSAMFFYANRMQKPKANAPGRIRIILPERVKVCAETCGGQPTPRPKGVLTRDGPDESLENKKANRLVGLVA